MRELSQAEIDQALERVEPSLAKYMWIMENVQRCDVSADAGVGR